MKLCFTISGACIPSPARDRARSRIDRPKPDSFGQEGGGPLRKPELVETPPLRAELWFSFGGCRPLPRERERGVLLRLHQPAARSGLENVDSSRACQGRLVRSPNQVRHKSVGRPRNRPEMAAHAPGRPCPRERQATHRPRQGGGRLRTLTLPQWTDVLRPALGFCRLALRRLRAPLGRGVNPKMPTNDPQLPEVLRCILRETQRERSPEEEDADRRLVLGRATIAEWLEARRQR